MKDREVTHKEASSYQDVVREVMEDADHVIDTHVRCGGCAGSSTPRRISHWHFTHCRMGAQHDDFKRACVSECTGRPHAWLNLPDVRDKLAELELSGFADVLREARGPLEKMLLFVRARPPARARARGASVCVCFCCSISATRI